MKPTVMKKGKGSDQSYRGFKKIFWVVQFRLSLSQEMLGLVRSGVTDRGDISCPQHILTLLIWETFRHSFLLRVECQKEKPN